jgi:hypothetical protein
MERLEQSYLHPLPKSYLARYYYDYSEPIQLFHYGTICEAIYQSLYGELAA